jgi:ring-1,2-phenylacetyl-CoA epoxidase subunit PaaD
VNIQAISNAVEAVTDPEIPVTLRDLGVVRSVERLDDDRVRIVLRPTRPACPGLNRIERDVRAAATAVADSDTYFDIEWDFGPWTAESVTPEGVKDLNESGFGVELITPQRCPYCASLRVKAVAPFGGAVCKAPYTCMNCGSQFDVLRSSQAG